MDIEQYHIGWICAILPELTAARLHLDKEHTIDYDRSPGDDNNYVFGSIDRHNIVVAALPKGEYGTNSAAIVARDMVRTFTQLKVMLMVGIGGGVPRYGDTTRDIRLGDVVVSAPGEGFGGVRQYDFGKALTNGGFEHTGHLNQPPRLLLAAVTTLASDLEARGNDIDQSVAQITQKPRLQRYRRPDEDLLFEAAFQHISGATCKDCVLANRLVDRPTREDNSPEVHYGLIGSGNTLVKNAQVRDALGRDGILCVEMEAAGLMNNFPVLVIRGICDYADSHKNKDWQGYAAMTAAAYARRLLLRLPANRAAAERSVTDLAEVKQQLNNISKDTASSVRLVTEQMNHLKLRGEEEILRDIEKWFAAPDSTASYHEALARRHAQTGNWLLKSNALMRWRQSGETSTLCLTGNSGCGKTVLSSAVVQDLLATKSIDEVVAYWYFAYDKRSQQTTSDMARSLIQQVCSQREKAKKTMRQLYDACGSGTRQPTQSELLKCFLQICKNAKTTLIVVDALDEAASAQELFSWLSDAAAPENIRLLVTSRASSDLLVRLQKLPQASLRPCQNNAISEDISAYVRATLEHSSSLQRWKHDPVVRHEIESELLEKSGNMFRWVALQLEGLAQCYTLPALREHLRSMPLGLDATYKRMLSKIPQQHEPEVLKTLQLLTYGRFELTLDEVVHAIAEDGNKLHDASDLEVICGGLVTIVDETDDANEISQYVRLTHQSVKDFLLSDDCATMIKGRLDPFEAHVELASTCLSYILRVDYESASWTVDEAFYDYAATSWMFHYKQAETKPITLVQHALQLMDKRSSAYLPWTLWIRLDKSIPSCWTTSCRCPLMFAIYNRIDSLVKELLRKPRCKPFRCDAITAASYHDHQGQLKLVDRLSAAGYQVTESSLAVACESCSVHLIDRYLQQGIKPAPYMLDQPCLKGDGEIVRLLIRYKIPIDNMSVRKAIQGQNIEVVRCLILPVNNVDLFDAFRVACQVGNLDIVDEIFHMDSKRLEGSDTMNECFREAAMNGKNNLARFLLARGVSSQMAFRVACVEGNLELLTHALASDAVIEQQGFEEAIRFGYSDVISLLGSYYLMDLDYQELLIVAARNGNSHAIEVLCEYIQVPSNKAVMAALEYEHHQVATDLLEQGAQLTNEDFMMIGRRNLATIRALLDNGLKPHQAILDEAVKRGYDEHVGLLLERGMSQNRYEIETAAEQKSFNIMQHFFDADALASGSADAKPDVLHTLRKWGHSDAELLDAAVDDNRVEDVKRLIDDGSTPLGFHVTIAVSNSSLPMVKLLLERNAALTAVELQSAALEVEQVYMLELLKTRLSSETVLEALQILKSHPPAGGDTEAYRLLREYNNGL